MPIHRLAVAELSLQIRPECLGFADTNDVEAQPPTWAGQESALAAARFGLGMAQPDYHVLVVGEAGSGRSALMQHAMQAVASGRPAPPDVCYVHNFAVPEQPVALRLPAGQGRLLQQAMLDGILQLQRDIPVCLTDVDLQRRFQGVEQDFRSREAPAYQALCAYARERSFFLFRQNGELLFTLVDGRGEPMQGSAVRDLPEEQRLRIDRSEQELRVEINHFLERVGLLERDLDERLAGLRHQAVQPLLTRTLGAIRRQWPAEGTDGARLDAWLDQVAADVLARLPLFSRVSTDEEQDAVRRAAALARYQVNRLVDNDAGAGAPALIEHHPTLRRLVGGIDYLQQDDALLTDFSRLRAGSLHRAHGGMLMLRLEDVLAEEGVWDVLRRFVRTGRLHWDETIPPVTPVAAVTLRPDPVDLDVKLILIATGDEAELLLQSDPGFARRFQARVVLAADYRASDAGYRAFAVWAAHAVRRLGLPPLDAAAVTRLLEHSHRQAEDQTRQSADIGHAAALIRESAAACRARGAHRVEAVDVDSALAQRRRRHDGAERRMTEALTDGDWLIRWRGEAVGQVNGLACVDNGVHRFGVPVRISAQTSAGADGVLNIEREVALSGPVHDKGVLVLESYLSALFAAHAPLPLDAAIVLEQEYLGVEGDSASCAELLALLSALSGLPLRQGIAVTGALNQHGELLPVGGINEKIEGYFRACEAVGLDGHQGVLIPGRNRRHLMLDPAVRAAVEQGRFAVCTADHVLDALTLLTGRPSGVGSRPGRYARGSVLGRAARTLQAYRRACQRAGQPGSARGSGRSAGAASLHRAEAQSRISSAPLSVWTRPRMDRSPLPRAAPFRRSSGP
ncbi:MAG: ATP-dependent protease [Rhodoferax sp.]|nr:ATP-dependent protease [Rhodoferax sp.]